jgi:hypothetical protein
LKAIVANPRICAETGAVRTSKAKVLTSASCLVRVHPAGTLKFTPYLVSWKALAGGVEGSGTVKEESVRTCAASPLVSGAASMAKATAMRIKA